MKARKTCWTGTVNSISRMLRFLMNPAHHQRHEKEFNGVLRQWLSMPYSDPMSQTAGSETRERYIWGATAGMLRNFYRFLSA